MEKIMQECKVRVFIHNLEILLQAGLNALSSV